MEDDFEKKDSALKNNDSWNGFLGIQRGARYYTKAGISSLYSEVYFLDDIPENEVEELPDYVLSDNLQADIDSSVWVCLWGLQKTKYFPSTMKVTTRMGAIPEGEREGVWVTGWEDYTIVSATGGPLYTADLLQTEVGGEDFPLSTALWFIVKDICECGDFLSLDWYRARIVYEYFSRYPLSSNNAYLIGELFKELCMKEQFEGDLKTYYHNLQEAKKNRGRGAQSTKSKAEELREFAVDLFVELATEIGPRLLLAPPDYQADTLRAEALKRKPNDFVRAGKPYSKEWFLRHIIEDRRLDIAQGLEAGVADKG